MISFIREKEKNRTEKKRKKKKKKKKRNLDGLPRRTSIFVNLPTIRPITHRRNYRPQNRHQIPRPHKIKII